MTDGTERVGELERFAVECALDAAWRTEFWIPRDLDYGFIDYLEAAAARNIGLLHGFEELAEDIARRGILPQTGSDQARLVTDGGRFEDGTERTGTLDWCVNGHEWCPGPDGPDVDGEAWGGKCADCCLWPDLGAYRGRYGWNEAYLSSGGASA